MSKQLGVRVSEDLYERVEARRGELRQSRVAFVEAALEGWLGDGPTTWPPISNERPSVNLGALEARAPSDANAAVRQDRQASDPDYAAMKRQRQYSKPFRPQLKGKR